MTLCTVYDGCSAKKEETLLQNDLYKAYLNSISFFCNTSYEIRIHHFCRKLVMHFNPILDGGGEFAPQAVFFK